MDVKTIAIARKLSGSPTDSQVSQAVNSYLERNPVQPYDDSPLKGEISGLKSDIAQQEKRIVALEKGGGGSVQPEYEPETVINVEYIDAKYWKSDGTAADSQSFRITKNVDVSNAESVVYSGLNNPGNAPQSVWIKEDGATVVFKQQSGENTIPVPSYAKYVSFSVAYLDEISMKLINKAPSSNKTVIVNFGDSIFGQARPPVDVSTFLAEMTDAKVYNAGFGGCQMGEHSQSKYDAFSMYRLADAIVTKDWSLQNAAVTQSGIPDYYQETLDMLKGIDFGKVDIITIGYGINDFLNGIKPRTTSTTNPYIGFGNAMEYSIKRIQAAYPRIRIFVCVMTYITVGGVGADTLTNTSWVDSKEYKYTDFVDEQINIAKSLHLPIIDNFYALGINADNVSAYFPAGDLVHHNEAGRRLIAKHIAKCIW